MARIFKISKFSVSVVDKEKKEEGGFGIKIFHKKAKGKLVRTNTAVF